MPDEIRESVNRRAGIAQAWHRLAARVARWFDPQNQEIRDRTLAGLLALLFGAQGFIWDVPGLGFLVQPPFDLDWALRTVSLGWYTPSDTIPVTIVDIDDDTNRSWNSPAVTPRGELARLLAVVTEAAPSAVVMDIDLSGTGIDVDVEGQQQLASFLVQYRGSAPLIFPKRIEPAADGSRLLSSSPFDAAFECNPRLSWGHASFGTDGDGAVRRWAEWIGVCAEDGARWLPAVAVRVTDALAGIQRGQAHATEPAEEADCIAAEIAGERRLLIGPRLTGAASAGYMHDARTVSAAVLLDPEFVRDDTALFAGRVVLIGATHAGSSDFWRTPAGVLSGVELLANAVRYAPFGTGTGLGAEVASRVLCLLLFAGYVVPSWCLRGLVAFLLGLVLTLLIVAIAMGGWKFLRVFEALESAILLTMVYFGLKAVLDLIADFKQRWKDFPPGYETLLCEHLARCA